MPEQAEEFKIAFVEDVQFKNWNCKNSIACRLSEVKPVTSGGWEVAYDYRGSGHLHTVEDLLDRLSQAGWVSHVPAQSTWRVAYELVRGESKAVILFRKNGIDLRAEGTWVNHWYHDSGVDLLEFCWEFAVAFAEQTGGYEKFFEQKGTRFPKPPRRRSDLEDIYDAFSIGDGSAAYIGDGIWMGSSGRSWDEGR